MPRLTPKVAAVVGHKVRLAQPRRRPRGRPFPKGNTSGFQKGESGNPGGKPKVFQKFSAKVAEEMLQPCPKEIKKALGLKRGATTYDAMVKALLLQAAGGDTAAFTTARETVEGRLVQKNVNISASLEALQNDPGFVEWLENKHGAYLMEVGSGSQTIDAAARSLPDATDTGSLQQD